MSYDPPSYVVNFAQTRKLPFKVAIDNTGAVAKAWGDVQLTPTTYIVNRRGEIVKRYVGEPDFAELHQPDRKAAGRRLRKYPTGAASLLTQGLVFR
jgi:peroxiredoxin